MFSSQSFIIFIILNAVFPLDSVEVKVKLVLLLFAGIIFRMILTQWHWAAFPKRHSLIKSIFKESIYRLWYDIFNLHQCIFLHVITYFVYRPVCFSCFLMRIPCSRLLFQATVPLIEPIILMLLMHLLFPQWVSTSQALASLLENLKVIQVDHVFRFEIEMLQFFYVFVYLLLILELNAPHFESAARSEAGAIYFIFYYYSLLLI